jgi:hypothetical protein
MGLDWKNRTGAEKRNAKSGSRDGGNGNRNKRAGAPLEEQKFNR